MSNPAEKEQASPLIRKNRGFGRRTPKGLIHRMAKEHPATVWHESSQGEIQIEMVQDISPILKQARDQRLSGHDGYSPDRSMRHVAHIPSVFVADLYRKGINPLRRNDWPKVARLLDTDWKELKTSEGRISRKRHQWMPTEGFDKRRNR